MQLFLSFLLVAIQSITRNAELRRSNTALLQALKALTEQQVGAGGDPDTVCQDLESGSNGYWFSEGSEEKFLKGGVTKYTCKGLCEQQNEEGVCAYKAKYRGCWFSDGERQDYNDRYGWRDEDHLSSVCTRRQAGQGKPTCILDHSSWETDFGRCSSYAHGSANHKYCADHGVDGYKFSASIVLSGQRVVAKQVCPECGECVSGIYTENCDMFDPVTNEEECEYARNALGLSVGSSGCQICRTGFTNIGPGRCEDYRGKSPDRYFSSSSDRSTCENACAANSECLGYHIDSGCKLLVASGTSFALGTPPGFGADLNYQGVDVSTTTTIGIKVGCMRKNDEGKSKPWNSAPEKLQIYSCATHEDCLGESVCIEKFCVAAVMNKQSAGWYD